MNEALGLVVNGLSNEWPAVDKKRPYGRELEVRVCRRRVVINLRSTESARKRLAAHHQRNR